MKKIFVLCVLSMLLFVLIASIWEMPLMGDIENPSYNEVAHYYIDNSVEETHAPNIIAAIITDYRAFDTLGETTVLFTAIAAVISVLKAKDKEEELNG